MLMSGILLMKGHKSIVSIQISIHSHFALSCFPIATCGPSLFPWVSHNISLMLQEATPKSLLNVAQFCSIISYLLLVNCLL